MTEAWQRTSLAGALREVDVGREVVLNGWVHGRRDHGGVIFLDVRDHAGIVQVVCRSGRQSRRRTRPAGDAPPRVRGRRAGYRAARAPAETVNPQMPDRHHRDSWPASS